MKNETGPPMITKGNVAQPDGWVDKYADYLFRFALSRVNDKVTAQDLVQETFLSALEHVSDFEGRSTEATWLTAILKNKIIDLYRKRSSGIAKRTESLEEQPDMDFFDAADGHWKDVFRPKEFGIAGDRVTAKEFTSILQQCMQKLPPLWFSVFSLKHMEDESSEKICKNMKITPSNFWVIMHRSKLNLRTCLEKNGYKK
ncbi:MAG: sigma-70 family RNA polymerase sigma factor [Sediminibacterium sp.]